MAVNILRLFDTRMQMKLDSVDILYNLLELDKELKYKLSTNTAHLSLGGVEYCIRFAVYPTPNEAYNMNGMLLSLFVCDSNEEVDYRLRMMLRKTKFSLKHKAVAQCLGGSVQRYFDERDWI